MKNDTGALDDRQTLEQVLESRRVPTRDCRDCSKFGADPEWLAARAKTEENGPIVASITNTMLTPTTFSSMK